MSRREPTPRVEAHGPFVSVADVRARLAEIPGSRGALYARALLDLGVLPQPPGTVHREGHLMIAGAAPPSMNTNEARSHWKPARAAKKEWEGRFAQALDGRGFDRPIRSVDADGELAPVFAHVLVTTPGGNGADSPNFWIAVKALGDALTGKAHPERKIDHEHRTYRAGWLHDDDDEHLLTWLEVRGGPRSVAVTFTWDEPIDREESR